jgi:hypothetical protein
MKEESKGIPSRAKTARLKRLPPRLRIAHLRALLGREVSGSVQQAQLASLLRDETAALTGEGGLLQ